MSGNFYTNPLFVSGVLTSLVLLVTYAYNSYQQRTNDREAKGLIYYFGLSVLAFGTSYGSVYVYNSLMPGGGGTKAIKDSVMKGGQSVADAVTSGVKKVAEQVKPTVENVVSESVTLEPSSSLGGGSGAEDFLNHGLPDW